MITDHPFLTVVDDHIPRTVTTATRSTIAGGAAAGGEGKVSILAIVGTVVGRAGSWTRDPQDYSGPDFSIHSIL